MSPVFRASIDTSFEPDSAVGQVCLLNYLIDGLMFRIDSELIDMWQVLCGDEAILRKVFSQLLEVLTLTLPYQEKHKGNKIVRHRTETPHSVNL